MILSVLLCTVCVVTMAQSQTVTHVVQRGETIESIAKYYNVSVEDINKANPNVDGIVYVGMKLNIPASASTQKEINNTETPKNDSSSNENRIFVSQSTYKTKKKVINDDNETTLGLQIARVKASYLFPTELEKSTRGHYRSSYNLSFVLEGEYVFNPNAFAGFGLGYMAQGSCNHDRNYSKEDGVSYQQYQSEYNYVMLPLSVGYRMPLAKNVNFDIYTGLTAAYIVSGYSQTRANTSEKWNKTKLKDMENAKRFTTFWTAGARVNLCNFELGAEYWYLLTKTNEGGSKRAIAAYFALHM